MNIRQCTPDESSRIAMIVSESNRDVAVKFGLNGDNCPKHPWFCTKDWILADFDRGVRYFMLEKSTRPVGCVAYESASAELAFLNRLSVLPDYRRLGGGNLLVQHIIDRARISTIKTISIGVIGEHIALQRWYRNLGFVDGEVKHFDHLPFTVKYMTYAL